MSKYKLKIPKKTLGAVVGTYNMIENGVVSAYKKVEDGFVDIYKTVENKFVYTFLENNDEVKLNEK